ncbi:antitoxin MazE-like protein [Pontimonas salivibrio]|uniref:antitoxin MazE-like protein n=1 Tax=Pontimonas salivibrio TaxID=1159327 RepID=UPI000CF35A7E|nr:antitoxin MazE-like protein [Pontimonas salivibrio]
MVKRSGDRRVRVRVADHRARLRGEGLKPVQMWLPDTSNAEVRAELAAVCHAIEAYPGAADDAAFVYALAEDDQ